MHRVKNKASKRHTASQPSHHELIFKNAQCREIKDVTIELFDLKANEKKDSHYEPHGEVKEKYKPTEGEKDKR